MTWIKWHVYIICSHRRNKDKKKSSQLLSFIDHFHNTEPQRVSQPCQPSNTMSLFVEGMGGKHPSPPPYRSPWNQLQQSWNEWWGATRSRTQQPVIIDDRFVSVFRMPFSTLIDETKGVFSFMSFLLPFGFTAASLQSSISVMPTWN